MCVNDSDIPSTLTNDDGAATRRLPIIEETLQVDKKLVTTGGIRLTKTVSSREEIVDPALSRSEFAVERREVGQLVQGDVPPAVRVEGDTTIYPILEEVVVTEKRLKLVAELHVRRVDVNFHNPQSIVLRKEQIDIERVDDVNPSSTS